MLFVLSRRLLVRRSFVDRYDNLDKLVRDLTESGDFYSGSQKAWAAYRAAVQVGDWETVMLFETGQKEDFRYDPYTKRGSNRCPG